MSGLEFLKKVDVEAIDNSSLNLLERVGLKLEHERIRQMCLAAGARPGREGSIIRFPRELVREFLSRAPSNVSFGGRGGQVRTVGPGRPSVFWTAAAMNIVGPEGRREFERIDLARLSLLVEALPGVDGVVGVSVRDVPPQFRDVAGYRTMATHTGKHVRVLSFTPAGTEAILEMSRVLAGTSGGAPIFSLGFTAHGPLRWTNLALDVFYRSAGHGIPVMVNGEPMAGGTAPVTLAGVLTVGNAEILGGIVVNQLLEPGRPCIHNLGFAHVLDMRTGVAVTGAPENCLLAGAGAALAKFYNLPSASWMSSDSMLADSQGAVEKTMSALTHAAAGVGVIWGAGSLESELSISLAQLVIDNEIIGQVRRLLRGVEVTPETIAETLIEEIGPCGNFLASEHTIEHFREEIYETGLFCRVPRERWEQEGSLPLAEAALQQAGKLIASACPPPVSPEEERELEAIEKRLLGKL